MHLQDLVYKKICENLQLDTNSNLDGLTKLKNSIFVLHNSYLLGSCKEAGIFLAKHNNEAIGNIFDFVMSIYNKRIKAHHSLFLVLHIFETALRSKIAVILSKEFSSQNSDDWFICGTNQKLINKVKHIANIKKCAIISDTNSFDVLDLFTFGDLENIIYNHWAVFKPLFANPKEYKNQKLPEYGTKEHLLKTISMLRKARNDIFHNNPPKIKSKSVIANIEILLLRLDFNLNDAFNNIANLKHSISLKYRYNE
ncbi:hypothetical protein CFT12S00416_01545 [Campylobacter fetus subsp. testudinum]|uniref:hypothetical protein n=1 Tax=Campylobacter fetus TaxID=196 RepID=UPI0008187AED|nr:hypothetical protein [Campylobacter fetus]OCR89942.1 hypothetical protein CFT12S00416_01545 [Campylobacter fetus subsp. testudinum]OCR99313.1 hypothetical protein A9K75_07440 [Campylobacter fetus subsp. testudinum]